MAELITWTEKYSVGIEKIDSQHKILVSLLNKLHAYMLEGKANYVLGEILTELIHYTETHFQTEETLFEEYGYPETTAHTDEHRELVKKVVAFKDEFDAGIGMLSIKIITFLKNWLIVHIMASDKEYTTFFHSKGLF